MTDDRSAVTAGLRAFADWLDANPEIPWARNWGEILMPLTTKERLDEVAQLLGAEVSEASHNPGQHEFTVEFGPITARLYGYDDFDAHRAQNAEKQARTWADGNGKQITDVEPAA